MDTQDNIGLKDIISLALKGYKPGDIRELVEIAKEAAQPDSGHAQDNTDGEDIKDDPELSEVPADVKEDPENSSDQEQLKAEIISLKEKIKELQSDNINKEVTQEFKTDEEKFEELVKNYF